MNARLYVTVCITVMLGLASAHANDNAVCVSNIMREVETTLTTDYRRMLARIARHQRAEIETQLTGALHRSYLLSRRLSQLLASNEAAAQLVASRLSHFVLDDTHHSDLIVWTMRTALFESNFRWSLHVCEALLTNPVCSYGYKYEMLELLDWLLSKHKVAPTHTQDFIRVHECAARVLACSTCSLERALAPRAVEHLACSRDPQVAARGLELAKKLRASAATERDRARFTRIIINREEPSRYLDFLESMLASSDEDIAWEAYCELTQRHHTNSVAMRAIEAKWTALRSGSSPDTNAAMRVLNRYQAE